MLAAILLTAPITFGDHHDGWIKKSTVLEYMAQVAMQRGRINTNKGLQALEDAAHLGEHEKYSTWASLAPDRKRSIIEAVTIVLYYEGYLD